MGAAATAEKPATDEGASESENVNVHLAPDEIVVSAPHQLTFDLGGKAATSSSIRLVGGKAGIADCRIFKKGEVVHFEGTAIVTASGEVDTLDSKTLVAVSCEHQHKARITDLRVVSSSED